MPADEAQETQRDRTLRLKRANMRKKREDPVYRQNEYGKLAQKLKDPKRAGQERDRAREGMRRHRERVREQRAREQNAALAVYGDYQRLMGWPQVPPRGLEVALSAETVGRDGGKAVVVTLNEPHPAGGPSGRSVPSLVADPSLDLTDARVRDQVFGADVDDRTREATVRAQEDLFNRLRAEEFGPEAVPPSPPAGQAQYADPAQPGEYPELFGDVNVDELLRSGAGADDSTWQLETPGPWIPAANPIAPSALTHLPGLEGQAPAYALSQAMENLSVTASHFPTADSYGPMSQHTNVAYTQWDTSAFQQPNTQPAPQTNAYQMGRPGGRTGRSGRPPRQ